MIAGHKAAGWFAHTLMALTFGTLGLVAIIYGQEIEARLVPVVVETQPADSVYRDETKTCFTFHLKKNVDGVDPHYECYAKALYSPRLPLSIAPSDAAHTKFGRDLTVHPVGGKWDRVFCSDLPQTIAQNQDFEVFCRGDHDRHPGWRSFSYLAPFKICGLTQNDPPADLPKKPDPYCDKQRESFRASR